MLTNLLPGIRELRAPLAAGYIWLLTIWLIAEPAIPEKGEAQGVVASLYRLAEGLSPVGLGVVASFAAYLVGSLSTTVFGISRGRSLRKRPWLDPLSVQARGALAELARTTRTELESALSMSGVDVEQLLDETGVPAEAPPFNPKIAPTLRKRRLDRLLRLGPGSARPRDFEQEQEARIAGAVTRDLGVIATTRLLGRDQELYSAIDRLRAEVEFRRALGPPILVVGVVLAIRAPWPWPLLILAVTMALAVGLLVDGSQLQRRMNELLLDVLTDHRVESPSLERLRSRARAVATRTHADDVERTASEVAVAIRQSVKRLEDVGRSEPTLAEQALTDARKANDVIEQAAPNLPPDVIALARQAVTTLTQVADAWVRAMKGEGFELDADAALHDASGLLQQFIDGAKTSIARLRAET